MEHTNYFSILKYCLTLYESKDYPYLIGKALSYIIQKDKAILAEVLYHELVGDRSHFDFDCLKRAN